MGWEASKVGRDQILILSTQGGLRADDGTPIALGYHTGHWDWKMARDLGKCEPQWPYDQRLVDEAQVDAAVLATHTAFDLDADEVEAVVYGGSGR